MKMKLIAIALTAITALALFSTGCAQTTSGAKLTKAQAEAIALQRAKGGTVKSSELEQEHGKLVWSFDIAKAGTKNVTEVLIDAKTGEVVSVAVETPADEAAEALKEAAEKKQ
jgi:predicted small secreted protein